MQVERGKERECLLKNIFDVRDQGGAWQVTNAPEGAHVPRFVPIDPAPETVEVMDRAAAILRQKLGMADTEWLRFEAIPVPFGSELNADQGGPYWENPWVDAAYFPLRGGVGVGFKATTQPWPGFKHELRRSGEEPAMMIVLRGRGLGPVEGIKVFFHSGDEPPTNHISRCEHVVWSGPVGGRAWRCNARLVNGQSRRQVAVDDHLYGPYCEAHGGYARALQEAGLPPDAEPVERDDRC